MSSLDVESIFAVLIMCAVPLFGIGLIVLFIYIIKKSMDQAKKSEQNINRMIANLPQDRQLAFMMQFNNSRKSPTTAVLLALFLGGLGAHKFYLAQTGMGIFYLLFFWTGIPAIIAFIEAFTLAGSVGKYNERKAYEAFTYLGTRIVAPVSL